MVTVQLGGNRKMPKSQRLKMEMNSRQGFMVNESVSHLFNVHGSLLSHPRLQCQKQLKPSDAQNQQFRENSWLMISQSQILQMQLMSCRGSQKYLNLEVRWRLMVGARCWTQVWRLMVGAQCWTQVRFKKITVMSEVFIQLNLRYPHMYTFSVSSSGPWNVLDQLESNNDPMLLCSYNRIWTQDTWTYFHEKMRVIINNERKPLWNISASMYCLPSAYASISSSFCTGLLWPSKIGNVYCQATTKCRSYLSLLLFICFTNG